MDMQTSPIQTGAAKEGGECGGSAAGVARGYKLLFRQKRAQKDTLTPDLTFYSTTHSGDRPKPSQGTAPSYLGHCPFMCTANEINSCKSGRGKGVLRSRTATSGLHLYFWRTCKVHPDPTFFTVDWDHRNYPHHEENVLNRLLPRTKILRKTP